MTRLFKKLDIAGVAVMLLAFFVAVGFTAAESRQGQWYEVEVINEQDPHDTPSNLRIVPNTGGWNPVSPCAESPNDVVCAIKLELGDVDFPSDYQELLDMIEDDEDISIEGVAHSPLIF